MILKRTDQSFIMGFKVVDVFLSLLLFRGGIQYSSETLTGTSGTWRRNEAGDDGHFEEGF